MLVSLLAKNPIVLRPRAILGAGRLGIMDFVFRRIQNNKPIYVLGEGHNTMQLLAIDDLVDAVMLAYEKRNSLSKVDFNLGESNPMTLRALMEELITYAGSKSRVKSLPRATTTIMHILDKLNLIPFTPWHYEAAFSDFNFDISKAEKLLGWKPKISGRNTLFSSYDWFLAHQHEVGNSPHKSRLLGGVLKYL